MKRGPVVIPPGKYELRHPAGPCTLRLFSTPENVTPTGPRTGERGHFHRRATPGNQAGAAIFAR